MIYNIYIYIFLLFYKSFENKILLIFYNFNNLAFLFYIFYPSDNVKTRSVNLIRAIMREQPLKTTLPYRNYYSHFAYFREKLDYIYRSDNDVTVKKQIKCNFRGIDQIVVKLFPPFYRTTHVHIRVSSQPDSPCKNTRLITHATIRLLL